MSHYDKLIFEFFGPAPTVPAEWLTGADVWMSVSNPADLERAAAMVEYLERDPVCLRLAEAGDKLSKDQTKHDVDHWLIVKKIGMSLASEIKKIFPGRLDEWTLRVVLPAALYLHDWGRAVDVDKHASAGARMAHIYFTRLRFPPEITRRICRIIALHRSGSVLKREFDDEAHAIVVAADKCAGDEDRVRPHLVKILKVLNVFGLARFNWWHEAQHDRVNFAMRSAEPVVECEKDGQNKDTCALVLKVALRTRVSRPTEVTNLYADRFHACAKAMQYLGFVFRMEFNGVRWSWTKATRKWGPVAT